MVLHTWTNISICNCHSLIPCYHQNSKGNVKHILFQQKWLSIYPFVVYLPIRIWYTHPLLCTFASSAFRSWSNDHKQNSWAHFPNSLNPTDFFLFSLLLAAHTYLSLFLHPYFLLNFFSLILKLLVKSLVLFIYVSFYFLFPFLSTHICVQHFRVLVYFSYLFLS